MAKIISLHQKRHIEAMQDRILLIMIIIVCVIGPGIHYFIGGRNFDNSNVWNILVGLQIAGGLAVIFFVGRQKANK